MSEVATRPNAQKSDVVLTVCPTGEHGGGDVLAGVWYRDGGATCACGTALVPVEQAPEAAQAAAAEVIARHAAQVAHPAADTSPAETATEPGGATTPETVATPPDGTSALASPEAASAPAPAPTPAVVVTTPQDGDSPRSLLGSES